MRGRNEEEPGHSTDVISPSSPRVHLPRRRAWAVSCPHAANGPPSPQAPRFGEWGIVHPCLCRSQYFSSRKPPHRTPLFSVFPRGPFAASMSALMHVGFLQQLGEDLNTGTPGAAGAEQAWLLERGEKLFRSRGPGCGRCPLPPAQLTGRLTYVVGGTGR